MNKFINHINSVNAAYLRRCLFFLWFVLNLLQAVFTEIHADEAYYMLYGSNLAWGYYDHPPMVALIVWLSSKLWIFGGNLSVRLMTVLLHTITVYIIFKTTDTDINSNRSLLWFFITGMSITMFNVYGFMTTPDVPLLFFTALFFYAYKKYLLSINCSLQWLHAILIGIAVGCMLLSKYMGFLVVLFTILSNPRLIADKKMWVAVLIGFCLFLPHLLWQYNNDFPSFGYHLVGRSTGVSLLSIIEYIPNQLLVFNPLVCCLMIYVAWKNIKTTDLFSRSLAWCVIGFVSFFWLTSLRGHVEPHWTVAASVAALILLLNWHEKEQITPKYQKLLWTLSSIMLCIILIARLVLALNVLPTRIGLSGKQVRYDKLHDVCGDVPVVFQGSFQEPALYSYFEGEPAVVLSEIYSRRTQYDILALENYLQSKPACVIAPIYDAEYYEYSGGGFYCYKAKSFQAANRVEVNINETQIKGDSLFVSAKLRNNYNVDFNFAHSEFPISVFVVGRTNGELQPSVCNVKGEPLLPAKETSNYMLACKLLNWDKKSGDTNVVICLNNSWIMSQNSKPFKIN